MMLPSDEGHADGDRQSTHVWMDKFLPYPSHMLSGATNCLCAGQALHGRHWVSKSCVHELETYSPGRHLEHGMQTDAPDPVDTALYELLVHCANAQPRYIPSNATVFMPKEVRGRGCLILSCQNQSPPGSREYQRTEFIHMHACLLHTTKTGKQGCPEFHTASPT